MQVGQGEGHQETFSGEGNLGLSELEDHIAALKGVDLVCAQGLQPGEGVGDKGLETGIVEILRCGWAENPGPGALDGVDGVMDHREKLEAEGKHVRRESRLDHVVGIDAGLRAPDAPLFYKGRDCPDGLKH